MKAAIYARVAVAESGDPLEQQARTCWEYAAQQGAEIVAVVQEVAAGRQMTPLFNALLSMMEDGSLESIICQDPTRISRDMRTLEGVQTRISELGGRVLFVK